MDSSSKFFERWEPWLVCLAAALFFYYVFFQLAMFNTISAPLLHDFKFNSTRLGYLSSSYFFADALTIIPAGILLDKFSIRRIALFVMTLCVLATYWLAVTHSYTVAVICRAVTGMGNAFAFLTSMQLAARWLPAKRLALGIGLIITIIMLGGIVAQTPLSLLTSAIGWRGSMLVNASLGVVFLVYMFYRLRDKPEGLKLDENEKQVGGLLDNLKTAMRNQQNWLCASYTALMNLPISLLGELWGIMYLTQAHHVSNTVAANIASMMFIGMIVGSPSMGWLSDQLGRRKVPMLIASGLILILILVISYIPIHSSWLLGGLFFLLGLLASAQVISYPAIAESNPLTITGTAMSIVAILLNLVSFVAQPLFGWLMHLRWDGAKMNGTAVYSLTSFHTALLLLPLAFLVSLGLASRVKETYCRHKQ